MTPQPLRPISYRNDPLRRVNDAAPKCIEYDFLSAGSTEEGRLRSNSITLDPIALNLPWRSCFPAARQCRFWSEAENAGKALLCQIKQTKSAIGAKKGLSDSDAQRAEVELSSKELERIVNASSAAVYMNPNCTVEEIEIISQLNLILWIHDDILESSDMPHESATIIEKVTASWADILAHPKSYAAGSGDVFVNMAQHIISTNDQGEGLIRGYLTWMAFMRSKMRDQFISLRDYLDFRAVDIGRDYILAAVKFGNNVQLSPSEEQPLATMIQLAMDHIIMTNDLFSYDKECRDSETCANAVRYLEQVLAIDAGSAKSVLYGLLTRTESRLHSELESLRSSGTLSEPQLQYVQGVIEAAAGNLAFSITTRRYSSKETGQLGEVKG
ncbi:terpenoid synthase [Aspergillus homomorphus CBS 101889]|uniref:Terpene synthase n=1 Tax=Aspergillus homomorphus (strain CBS 101889) TaxID=1450537 RepID=A0A395I2E8_ASPHC|nr:terpenoid synthase [Aspergillus homomorphus CBS 101889]RAL13905.1 terpenoid synthase [Aspergillus homomorphus CBS 101889]